MPLALFVAALLILFGVYSVAPVFGVDELYPDLFRPYGPLSWAMAGLVVLGALWWGLEKVQRSGWKKDPSSSEAVGETKTIPSSSEAVGETKTDPTPRDEQKDKIRKLKK